MIGCCLMFPCKLPCSHVMCSVFLFHCLLLFLLWTLMPPCFRRGRICKAQPLIQCHCHSLNLCSKGSPLLMFLPRLGLYLRCQFVLPCILPLAMESRFKHPLHVPLFQLVWLDRNDSLMILIFVTHLSLVLALFLLWIIAWLFQQLYIQS